jgi:hypothetical protein
MASAHAIKLKEKRVFAPLNDRKGHQLLQLNKKSKVISSNQLSDNKKAISSRN